MAEIPSMGERGKQSNRERVVYPNAHEAGGGSIERPAIEEGTQPVIKGRWKIMGKIGQGAFGEIHSALDLVTSEQVAVKLERLDSKKQVMRLEVSVLRKLQDSPYVARFIACGHTSTFNYLIMELLGESLSDLRRSQSSGRFPVPVACKLANQSLRAIEEMHERGFIHRDIKPSNVCLARKTGHSHSKAKRSSSGPGSGVGGGQTPAALLVDFGLARRFTDSNGSVIAARDNVGFRGTARYASVNSHLCRDLGRRDDLFSLYYVIIELVAGGLPWRALKEKDEIHAAKMLFESEARLQDPTALPPPEYAQSTTSTLALSVARHPEIVAIAAHLRGLRFADVPDYALLHRLLNKFALRIRLTPPDIESLRPRQVPVARLGQNWLPSPVGPLTPSGKHRPPRGKAVRKAVDIQIQAQAQAEVQVQVPPISTVAASGTSTNANVIVNEPAPVSMPASSTPLVQSTGFKTQTDAVSGAEGKTDKDKTEPQPQDNGVQKEGDGQPSHEPDAQANEEVGEGGEKKEEKTPPLPTTPTHAQSRGVGFSASHELDQSQPQVQAQLESKPQRPPTSPTGGQGQGEPGGAVGEMHRTHSQSVHGKPVTRIAAARLAGAGSGTGAAAAAMAMGMPPRSSSLAFVGKGTHVGMGGGGDGGRSNMRQPTSPDGVDGARTPALEGDGDGEGEGEAAGHSVSVSVKTGSSGPGHVVFAIPGPGQLPEALLQPGHSAVIPRRRKDRERERGHSTTPLSIPGAGAGASMPGISVSGSLVGNGAVGTPVAPLSSQVPRWQHRSGSSVNFNVSVGAASQGAMSREDMGDGGDGMGERRVSRPSLMAPGSRRETMVSTVAESPPGSELGDGGRALLDVEVEEAEGYYSHRVYIGRDGDGVGDGDGSWDGDDGDHNDCGPSHGVLRPQARQMSQGQGQGQGQQPRPPEMSPQTSRFVGKFRLRRAQSDNHNPDLGRIETSKSVDQGQGQGQGQGQAHPLSGRSASAVVDEGVGVGVGVGEAGLGSGAGSPSGGKGGTGKKEDCIIQ